MAVRSLGKVTVTTAGTPVRATTNETTPTARVGAQSMFVQTVVGNTGYIYVGDRSSMNKSTGVGVIGIIPIPTANTLGSVTVTVVNAPAGLNANEIWLDSTVNAEGAIVAITEQ